MRYSREMIAEAVRTALASPATLYNSTFLRYSYKSDRLRTAIAAEELLKSESMKLLDRIPQITRKSYKTPGHDELAKRDRPLESNRDEDWLAIEMFGKSFDGIGEIQDFQVPLKGKRSDKSGKIDLLSYDEPKHTAYLLELKRRASRESLLRCVLEAYTYWKTVDKNKLLSEYGFCGAELRKGALIFSDSSAYSELLSEDFSAVHTLMGKDMLDVDLFVLNEDGTAVIHGYTH